MMPDIIPQKTWEKAHEFFDALANGTTDLQQLAAKDAQIAAQIASLQAKCEALADAEAREAAAYERGIEDAAAKIENDDPLFAAAIRQLKGQHHD
jgi:hypothetical protein